MFHLDLPQLRIGAFERTPRVACAIGDLRVDVTLLDKTAIKRDDGRTHYTPEEMRGRAALNTTIFSGATAGSLWAPCLFGADSMATKSEIGGNVFGFFVCDEFTPSAERFSPEEACESGVGILKGIGFVGIYGRNQYKE